MQPWLVSLFAMPPTSIYQVSELSGIALTRCSSDLRYVYANPAASHLLGLPVERIVGHPIIDVMGKEAFSTISPYVAKVLRGEMVSYEAQIPYSGARTTWIHATYTPDIDATGKVVGWIGAIVDISDRKHSNAVTSQETPELVVDGDATGRIEAKRDAARRARWLADVMSTDGDRRLIQLFAADLEAQADELQRQTNRQRAELPYRGKDEDRSDPA